VVSTDGLIRVAFRPLGSATWLGGKHYLWNLCYAISRLERPRVRPVIVASTAEAGELAALPGVDLVPTDGPLGHSGAFLVGRVCKRVLGRDLVAEHWYRRAGAQVASHGFLNGRFSTIPTIFWIPDLQHLHLPDLFDDAERRRRDGAFREAFDEAALVILSSETARRDVAAFYGTHRAARCRVLRFVSQPRLTSDETPPLDALVAKHGIPRRYFHLPNQFWKHKNHRLVVESLAGAPDACVVATGAREDFRNPEHYESLMGEVRRRGLEKRFLHLGTVPFPELVALMRSSLAVINPSRFEGWSSTVEEAKSLGKTILLSDLPVHREQAPERGHYFSPDDAARLAQLMWETAQTYDPASDRAAAETASRELPDRTRRFALAYETIVVEALSRR
jgi:glycosyltransferase involved in cell wall biosynthesis